MPASIADDTFASIGRNYSLHVAPSQWGTPLSINQREPDDILHNPDPSRDKTTDDRGNIFTLRGLANIGCLLVLVIGLLGLFGGYPIVRHFTGPKFNYQGGFNLGGINATGQVGTIPGNFALVDKDTPEDAKFIKAFEGGDDMVLVFSDEFNQDGRSFYPGDDPFWEAVDLHYWGTDNLEWYDPMQATTKNGNLQLRMEKVQNPADNHNMTYKSAMVQTWNKFCFTGGLVLASIKLPGNAQVPGLWPALWTMGNLGRAGYGATLDGLWPYTYDSCDVGTLPNQTYTGENLPAAALTGGDGKHNDVLSFLPGQRLSACTCPGESHPGPVRSDGSYVGRSAPEIDVVEATIIDGIPYASMSTQFAPFDSTYDYDRTQATIMNNTRTKFNEYKGGVTQETASCIVQTNPECYEDPGTCYSTYGMEYSPGWDGAYISWIRDVQAWTVNSAAFESNANTEIGRRLVPQEPLYLIANLGMASGFGTIDANIDSIFPATMEVDWIRVYQRKDQVNVGCNPPDFPTAAYISTYSDAYQNFNLTTWEQYGQTWPKNCYSPSK